MLSNVAFLLYLALGEVESAGAVRAGLVTIVPPKPVVRWVLCALSVAAWMTFIASENYAEMQAWRVFHGAVLEKTYQCPHQHLIFVLGLAALCTIYGVEAISFSVLLRGPRWARVPEPNQC